MSYLSLYILIYEVNFIIWYIVGCCLTVTTARRARCRISVDYEVSAIYNQDDNSWMIRMYWGDRPKCQVLLSYGKTNSDQSFKKSITNTCKKIVLRTKLYNTYSLL